ncbi:MAG: CDP-glycerol glycerophosphotransferase family protein [Candidatus Sumerlaeia bacterium]|nr:CDP-glycerol glycerophosphotransferase family protein [Candidatus Sumerlaeia bacterium]
MNYVMFRRVADRLRGDPRLRIFVFAEDAGNRDIAALYAPLGLRADDFTSSFCARLGRFDLYVSADPKMIGRRCRKKAHIFHGMSFKGKAFTPQMARYDRLFLFGEYQRRRFVEKGIFPPDDPRFVLIGMPKLDPLVDGSLDRRAIAEQLGLDLTKPTVLYAPTWSSRSSIAKVGSTIVELIGRLPVNFVVKLHDLSLLPGHTKFGGPEGIRQLQQQFPSFHFVSDYDVTPLLFVSDLLISDASSVANEFLVLDRPIIFLDVPELFAHYRKTIDLDTWGRRTGYVVSDAAQLPDVVLHALKHPDEHADIRRAAAADYFHDPGRATDRAVAEIYRLLEIPPK